MFPLHLYLATTPAQRQIVAQLVQTTYAHTYPGNDYQQSIAGLDPNTSVESLLLLNADESVPLGTISIMRNDGGQLPSETLMDLVRPNELPTSLVEVGRTAKNLTLTDAALSQFIFPALVVGAYAYLIQCGCPGFVCTVKQSLFGSMRGLGLQPRILQRGFLDSDESLGAYRQSETFYVWVGREEAQVGLTKAGLLNCLHDGTLIMHLPSHSSVVA